jgi:hypothetical protein
MLCAHRHLSCGPETHVFDGLTDAIEAQICSEASWPDAAVEYLFSIEHGEASIPVDYGISRHDLTDYLRNADNTITSVASALPALFMKTIGKVRWIDKTPDYQLHVRALRKHFPRSPIVRIVRDPRDVALSLKNVSWGPQTFLEGILIWHKYQDASKEFFESDDLSYSMRFEELVAAPERELTLLCEFLGESFEKDMLNTELSVNHVNRRNEQWKTKVGEKIDKSRANAWIDMLTEEERRQADAIVGNYTERRSHLAETLQFVHVVGLTLPLNGRDLYVIRKLIRDSNVRLWSLRDNEPPVQSLSVGRRRPGVTQNVVRRCITLLVTGLGLKPAAKCVWYYLYYALYVKAKRGNQTLQATKHFNAQHYENELWDC